MVAVVPLLHILRPRARIGPNPSRSAPLSNPEQLPGSGAPPEIYRRDQDLLQRWRAGEPAAGVELLDHYTGLFYRTCRRFGAHREEIVQEVWQELVLALLQRLPELPERVVASFAGFLIWQTRAATDRVLGRASVPTQPIEEVADGRDRGGFEAIEAIEHCKDKLPPGEKRIFDLRYLKGLSLQEAASELGSNANAVGQGIFRLSRKMRECLQRAGYGVGS